MKICRRIGTVESHHATTEIHVVAGKSAKGKSVHEWAMRVWL